MYNRLDTDGQTDICHGKVCTMHMRRTVKINSMIELVNILATDRQTDRQTNRWTRPSHEAALAVASGGLIKQHLTRLL